jgi:YD repeat-containing protein
VTRGLCAGCSTRRGRCKTQLIASYGTSAALTTTYTHDAQGQATQVQDGLGNSTTSSYDADHDVLSSTDANGHQKANYYQYVGPSRQAQYFAW